MGNIFRRGNKMKKVLLTLLILTLFIQISYSQLSVKIVSPKNGETVSGNVTIKVEVSDPKKLSKIEFYINKEKVGEVTKSPFEYIWNTTLFPNGEYTVIVKAYEKTGSTIGVSIKIKVSNKINYKYWQKTYGGSSLDVAVSIQQISDGGYIVAGMTSSLGAGNWDVYVIKLDANGNKVWEKIYGGSNDDWANSIQQTKDGGYIVAGYTESFGAGNFDFYIIKLDAYGNKVWEKTYGGSNDDWANSIQQTKDGGYIVAGSTESFGAGERDVYVIKLNEDGDKIWEKTYGGSNDDWANSIQQTKDGGYIVAGSTESFGGGWDVYIIKLNEDGDRIWEKTYGRNSKDWASSIQQTRDGGYIIAGGTGSLELGGNDFYIIKLKTDGNVEWVKTYGGGSDDKAYSIQQTNDGGYIVAGYTRSLGIGKADIYIIKLDIYGNKVWEKTYGGSNDDWANSIQQTKDGGYIVAGVTNSFGAGDFDVYMIKINAYDITKPYPTSTTQYTQKDNTPPQVSIINPQNGKVVSGTVKIEVKATDNVGVTKVEFYIDGKKVGDDTTSPYEYSWNTNTLQYNSTHTIQAKAYDKAGNIGKSLVISVTIGDSVVKFTDPNLEKAVRDALKIPAGQPITKEKMKELKSLDASKRSISNLTGLEYAVKLQWLNLANNYISDISPLSKLINLKMLDIVINNVIDISPLSNLTDLRELYLGGNNISDINPLSKLTNLQLLYLEHNPISDISPLSNLINLRVLFLVDNKIKDISPLSNLINLQYLRLDNNQIIDISPLANLTNLKELRLSNNQISDIRPLVNNTGLGEGDEVYLENNLLDLSIGSDDMKNIKILQSRGVKVCY